jgi:hypothetical protein
MEDRHFLRRGRQRRRSHRWRRTGIALGVLLWLCVPLRAQDARSPSDDGLVTSMDALPPDGSGAPDLSSLRFVSPRVEDDPEMAARIEALAAELERMDEALTRETTAIPLLAEPEVDPLSPPRMDSGDPNPDRLGEPPDLSVIQ